MKDLCTAERISEFLQAGATTFKIEGRNRRAEYAAGALLLYSEALNKNPITQKLTDMKSFLTAEITLKDMHSRILPQSLFPIRYKVIKATLQEKCSR